METIKTITVGGKSYALPQPNDTVVGGESWSSKKIIDTLCPAFSESGTVVTCTPVAGYPLTVTAEASATQITRCGKNLAVYPYTDKTKTVKGITFTENGDGSITINGTATGNATYFFADKKAWPVKKGVTYTAKLHKLSGSATYSTAGEATPSWMVNYYPVGGGDYLSWTEVFVGGTKTAVCPERMHTMASYIVVKTGSVCSNLVVRPQLEAGTAATGYVPYRKESVFDPGTEIPAWEGVNTLYADQGEITVSGRADPRIG